MIVKSLAKLDSLTQNLATQVPEWVLAAIVRMGLFLVFWRSAQTKLGGDAIFGQKLAFWNLSDNAFMLFEYEYAIPILPPNIAAYMGTWGEFFFALGLLFGLMTRLSALGLFFVSLVILYVYPSDWPSVTLWVGLILYLFKNGAGSLSLDALIRK